MISRDRQSLPIRVAGPRLSHSRTWLLIRTEPRALAIQGTWADPRRKRESQHRGYRREPRTDAKRAGCS
jgi:hypothetical protein